MIRPYAPLDILFFILKIYSEVAENGPYQRLLITLWFNFVIHELPYQMNSNPHLPLLSFLEMSSLSIAFFRTDVSRYQICDFYLNLELKYQAHKTQLGQKICVVQCT